jgi:hypothetical protein
VFAFGVANELLSERAKDATEQRLNAEIRDLRRTSNEAATDLAEVRSQLTTARAQLQESIGISQGLRTALDAMGGTLVRIASFEIAAHELPGLHDRAPIGIRAGDEVEWNLTCHAGNPLIAEFGGNDYGRFLADNMNAIPVSSYSGRSSVSANTMVGAPLNYELPWGSQGDALQRAMRRSLCVLHVRIYREARYVLEESLRLEAFGDRTTEFARPIED